MPTARKYKIRYREIGTSRWTTKNANASTKVLRSLISGVDYEYQIRARCDFGWTEYSTIRIFNTQVEDNTDGGGNTDSNCSNLVLSITLDYYGSETSWELVNQDFQTVATGGPYQDGQEGKVINEEFCLENGCYTLYVDDQYGDGICCEYGDGSFSLKNKGGSEIAFSDGVFGNYDNVDFCVEGGTGSLRERNTSKKPKRLARKKGYVKN